MVYIKHRRQVLWMPRISKDRASRHGGTVKSSEGLEVQGIHSTERMECQIDCPLFWEGEDGPNTVRDTKKSIQGFYVKGFTHVSFKIATPRCDA